MVPTISPIFSDIRSIKGSLDSIANGFDPQIKNPSDPWERRLNYPSIWIGIADVFDLQHETNFLVFASVMIICFWLCCFRLLITSSSIWVLLLAFSGSALLAVERGNTDIAIFSLLLVSTMLPIGWSAVVVWTSTALKIYPLFATIAFVRSKWVFVTMLAAIAGLLFYLWPELTNIRAGTPVSRSLSYGSASISAALLFRYELSVHPHLISAVLLLAACLVLTKPFLLDSQLSNENDRRLFYVGAAIFCGTFVLSSNYDYRLIFCMFCIPYVNFLKSEIVKYTILVSMLTAANQVPLHTVVGATGYSLNVLAKCVLFVGLSAMVLGLLKSEEPVKRVFRRFGLPNRNTESLKEGRA